MSKQAKRNVALLAAMLGTTVLAGCTMGPDYKTPELRWPNSWFSGPKEPVKPAPGVPVAEPIDPAWWNLFGDPVLSSLEHRVADGNFDVRIAATRFAESQAQLQQASASLFPTLDGNASYVREKAANKGIFAVIPSAAGATGANGAPNNSTGGVQGTGLAPFDLYQGGLEVSWEVDLWGRARRTVESASATSEAAAEATRGALLSSLAAVAQEYIDLRGIQEQLHIARENVSTARQSLSLTQQRAAGGVTTDLDVANASAQLRTTLAQIPTLEEQEAQLINALSLLVGEAPNALRDELASAKPVPPVPPRVPVGVPSDLARRRPDIRQADAQLHAATASIGVAKANFYPSLNLTASAGLQALQFGQVFNTQGARNYAMGPGLTIPIFEGGQLTASLHLAEAQQMEAALNFQKTVLTAWHEVDNALTAYQAEQIRRDELVRAVADTKRALGLAQSRYQQGVSDFLSVLDAERSLLAAQLQLASSTTTVSTNLVALYKALGGGWEVDMPEKAAAK